MKATPFRIVEATQRSSGDNGLEAKTSKVVVVQSRPAGSMTLRDLVDGKIEGGIRDALRADGIVMGADALGVLTKLARTFFSTCVAACAESAEQGEFCMVDGGRTSV